MRHHDRRSIAIRPAQLKSMLIGTSTQHITIDQLDDLSAVVSDSPFIDLIAIHP